MLVDLSKIEIKTIIEALQFQMVESESLDDFNYKVIHINDDKWVKIKNYFYGSLIGLAPQLFIGVSLGAGVNKLIDDNENMPSFLQMILTPDIYLPIFGLIAIFIIAFFSRKKFFKYYDLAKKEIKLNLPI